MRKSLVFAILVSLCLPACQPAPNKEEPKPKPHEPLVLDYTLLGIWPDRFMISDMTEALGEAGIRFKLSGYQPCVINVEAAKLGLAQDIASSNPEWQQARIR